LPEKFGKNDVEKARKQMSKTDSKGAFGTFCQLFGSCHVRGLPEN